VRHRARSLRVRRDVREKIGGTRLGTTLWRIKSRGLQRAARRES
jgi:hypothetical protein